MSNLADIAAREMPQDVKGTAVGQFHISLCDAADEQVPVSVVLKNGMIAYGFVRGMVSRVTFTLSETDGGYTPEWEVPFEQVAAIRREFTTREQYDERNE